MNFRLHSEVSSNLARHFFISSIEQSSMTETMINHKTLNINVIQHESFVSMLFMIDKTASLILSFVCRRHRLIWLNHFFFEICKLRSLIRVLMIFVADCASRCSNDSASSLHVFNIILLQLLRIIWKFDSYQSHSFLSLFYFRSSLRNQEVIKWQDALTRWKDHQKSHIKRLTVSWNERSWKSINLQSSRNEDVEVLRVRWIHEMQISKLLNSCMTHEHRSFRRSLDSNVINREKIAAIVLKHFLHWFVFLCKTRWHLHLHAQLFWDYVIISLWMWDLYRRSQTDLRRLLSVAVRHFSHWIMLQQSSMQQIRLCWFSLKTNTSNQCHDKLKDQLSRDEMRVTKRDKDETFSNR